MCDSNRRADTGGPFPPTTLVLPVNPQRFSLQNRFNTSPQSRGACFISTWKTISGAVTKAAKENMTAAVSPLLVKTSRRGLMVSRDTKEARAASYLLYISLSGCVYFCNRENCVYDFVRPSGRFLVNRGGGFAWGVHLPFILVLKTSAGLSRCQNVQ